MILEQAWLELGRYKENGFFWDIFDQLSGIPVAFVFWWYQTVREWIEEE